MLSPEDWKSTLARARAYASWAHAGQRYGAGAPYSVHLQAVEAVLRRFGASEETDGALLVAAWLHDVVEDTGKNVEQMRSRFGDRVAALVWAVTDEPGPSRRERHERTFPKTRSVRGAVRLKLADRIANVEAAREERPDLLRMYTSEHAEFEAALRRPGEHEDMWGHLASLIGESRR